jgi:hypothetical protein
MSEAIKKNIMSEAIKKKIMSEAIKIEDNEQSDQNRK